MSVPRSIRTDQKTHSVESPNVTRRIVMNEVDHFKRRLITDFFHPDNQRVSQGVKSPFDSRLQIDSGSQGSS